ncbi:MAG: TonB-dependent receptor, partial [Acidobacteria bacterium]|nr:TonB-dependent receptor [Acidobacteriota bacterium]
MSSTKRTAGILFFLSCGALQAQLTLSTIRGTVSDPSGATVANGAVTATSVETNARRTVRTNESGDFEIPDLPPGTYKVSVEVSGFKTFVADNVILESNQTRRIDVRLELGAVGSEVTVSAGAAVISTDTAKIQNTITGRKYADVPIVGSEAALDPSIVLTTTPMVNQTGGVWSSQWAGQSSSQVQEGQDGHTNDNAVNQLNDILDVQEVTVVTVNNSAEFARVGYMNMVTKSGSNEFHGRAMFWHQNSALASREFFEDTKAKQLFHIGSGSASGPIRKDKLFFYGSANFLKVPAKQFYLRTVPTEAMRGGDFSQLLRLPKPVVINDPSTGRPFPNNVIPSNRLSGVSLAVNQKYLPAPNRGGPDSLSNNYSFVFPFPSDYSLREDFTQRFDYNVSAKNRVMGRVIENWDKYVLPTNFPAFSWTRLRYNVHVVGEDTHVFSPTLVNSLRIGMYLEQVNDGQPLYGVTPFRGDEAVKAIGLQGVNPKGYSAEGFPRMNISGYPDLRTQAGGLVQDDRNWGYADTVTWNKGRHVVKFGGEFKPQRRFQGNIPEGTYGTFTFDGSITGYGYADMLLGIPESSTRLDPLTNRMRRDNELGLFVTDSFKMTSRLTLDMGLRWDRFGSPYYEDGLILNWDPATGNVIVPADARNRISPLYPKNINIVTGDVAPQPRNTNFVPRIGAAYRVRENMVVRGGYGIFSETLGRYALVQGGGPFQISETYQNVITNGQPLFQFPNPFPASLAAANIPSQSVTGYPRGVDNGKIHQWNLTVERQWKDIGFSLAYVGSHNYGMNYSIGVNKPQPSLTPFTAARRPWPQFVGASYWRNNGEAKYNAFVFQAKRKVGSLTFDGHWTWASNYNNTLNREDPYAPLYWNRDPYTPRHRVVLNAVWELPVGKGRHFLSTAPAVLNGVLGGWQVYWIGFFETGHFFTPSYSGSDPSNTNTRGGLPDRVCNGNLPSGQRSVNRWFDASCFAVPPAGRFGNAGVNILEGPGYNMQDISVAKTFPITERWRFTFTTAFSNAFNHPNFTPPAANISAPGSVGVVSGLVE